MMDYQYKVFKCGWAEDVWEVRDAHVEDIEDRVIVQVFHDNQQLAQAICDKLNGI